MRSVRVKYTDDITLLHHVGEDDTDMSQEEVTNIINWSKENGTFLNEGKDLYHDSSSS